MATTTGISNFVIIIAFFFQILYMDCFYSFTMFLKMLSFENKECTKEQKLECANFLGVLVYWNENVSEVRLYLTNNDDMWLRLLYILRQWFCCWFVVDCCSWCWFCVCSMVCYELLCVFSRFTLILMLASATSMWERSLDLKVYVFLLTIPWRCFFCGSFLLLIFCVCHAILSSIYCSLVVTCLERADLLALLYVVMYCVLSLPDGVSWFKFGTWV